MSASPPRPPARSLVGYEVAGRHGALGVVVDADEQEQPPMLVVEGGATGALVFHVPLSAVESVDGRVHLVRIDGDVASFVPSLREDGRVQLLLRD